MQQKENIFFMEQIFFESDEIQIQKPERDSGQVTPGNATILTLKSRGFQSS